MPAQKPDAQEICDSIDCLREELWLGDSRKWWPKYLVHFTDIKNAIQIISEGKLLSRSALGSRGGIPLDVANQEIIGSTRSAVTEHVRLYFKPRPPMQYQIEGFRPSRTDKHCPVPVVFLFDSKAVLSLANSKFSAGNLASSNATLMSSADDFIQLPFKDIYHDQAFHPNMDSDDRQKIIFHRHAEVVVPDQLPLDGFLRNIWCRSKAEKETLVHHLSYKAWKKYKDKIGANPKYPLFYERWTFIKDVQLSKEKIVVKFHPAVSASDRGPFHFRLNISEAGKPVHKKRYFVEERNYSCVEPVIVNVDDIPYKEYKVQCLIDGKLAYESAYYDFDDIF
ncbi:MAG: hypothetical protein OM95_06165 [Bdellovibrio sp. ArHS]|uniref:DarT ssDNA thymidine ADP-ribosyltransferase family protein n=1 Tax=Bdellovibrio sp. ArHS TaxID=1569284 RepID=UPI000582B5B1|nr:DarT ssDNA thymidine ADP-ribosyltransferase family protein [Bdellovibrio sp. ArHS]KHD89032.1 MAG: hypothetical protein OM95_06165 [Bdellovibrio sp. ArHS]